MNAELRRRELVLSECAVKELEDLVRSRPELAPPRLVIVIDEFAVLKKELPTFLDGITDLAQRGRSLGLHLVLATQRPTGVVDDRIRNLITLRICLRVVDPHDSQDVIDVPDAARLSTDQRGRALVRTGPGSLTEVQVAYGGEEVVVEGDGPAVQVGDLDLGRTTVVAAATAAGGATELQWLVESVRAAAEQTARHAPPPPWLPPLPGTLRLADLPSGDEHSAVVGLVDRPAQQRQDPFAVDLQADGSIAIYGAARSGKSTLLRTIAASLASSAPPEEVQLYGLDFGSGGLAGLDQLPHCGAVVRGSDDERVRRLVRQLRSLIAARRQRFAETGAVTLDDLRSRTGEPAARVVLLLDDYGALVAAYERVDLGELVDAIPRLVADGPGVGVHVVLTADRRGAVPAALHGTITRRIVLELASPDEYSALGVDARAAGRERPPGRAFVDRELEAQIAIVGEQPDIGAQVEAMAAIGAGLRDRHPGADVPRIDTLPASVDIGSLPAGAAPLVVPFAVGDDHLGPVDLDLAESHVLIAGPHRSGRTTTLATVAMQLQAAGDAELVLLSPRRTPLGDLVPFSRVALGDDCQDLASALAAEVELRRDDGSERALVVIVDDLEELFDTAASTSLERLARRGRGRSVCIVGACESKAGLRAFGGVVPEVKKSRRGVLLMPDVELDGELLGVRLPRRTSARFVPGRGFLVDRGQIELVQVALPSGVT